MGGFGHRQLEGSQALPYVQLSCHRILVALAARYPRLKAVSSLASGADTVFAQCAKALAIPQEFILPFAQFEADFTDAETLARYQRLQEGNRTIQRLAFPERDQRAYRKSMETVVFRSHLLIAAWDGRCSGSPGGTWQAVSLCERLGRSLVQIDTEAKQLHLLVTDSRRGLGGRGISMAELLEQL